MLSSSSWRPLIALAHPRLVEPWRAFLSGVDLWEPPFVQLNLGLVLRWNHPSGPYGMQPQMGMQSGACTTSKLDTSSHPSFSSHSMLCGPFFHAAHIKAFCHHSPYRLHNRSLPLKLRIHAPASSPCPTQRGSVPPSRPVRPGSASPTQDEPRVYGFDMNQNWKADAQHHDCQKVDGLLFPRTIRSSAFTQRLDVEGCDPLALPVAALLYQQADNFWLRKLAHGRELYIIPAGDIAALVFAMQSWSPNTSRTGFR
eukprot:s211_g9.t1